MLFPERPFGTVLEIGCGNGALFEPLGFDKTDYTGVDLSQSMIDVFAERYPRLRLVVGRGDEYRDGRKYDLIFCNGVVQYFDKEMLDRYITNAAAMLAKSGCIVISSIPWRTAYLRYHAGELNGEAPPAWLAAVRIVRSLRSDMIGRWYSVSELTTLGKRHGFRVEVFGSVHYCYRFHVRMRRFGALGESASER